MLDFIQKQSRACVLQKRCSKNSQKFTRKTHARVYNAHTETQQKLQKELLLRKRQFNFKSIVIRKQLFCVPSFSC